MGFKVGDVVIIKNANSLYDNTKKKVEGCKCKILEMRIEKIHKLEIIEGGYKHCIWYPRSEDTFIHFKEENKFF